MYLPLPLVRALDFMDERTAVVHRRFVPPSFAEVRRIIDLAVVRLHGARPSTRILMHLPRQVYAVAPRLQLITFDADETIYPDSGSLTLDAPACSFLPEVGRGGGAGKWGGQPLWGALAPHGRQRPRRMSRSCWTAVSTSPCAPRPVTQMPASMKLGWPGCAVATPRPRPRPAHAGHPTPHHPPRIAPHPRRSS